MSSQSPPPAQRTERLALGVLLSYACAQFGLSAMNTLVNAHVPFFYVDTLRLPASFFALVMLIGKFWDAITDPVMGHVTDNTRLRIGRRRPYFLIGAPLLGLFTFLLFSPPAGLRGEALFGWLLLTFLLAYTARTVFETPYQAMAPDLTPDYDERTRLATYRVTIGNLGDMTGALVPLVLLTLLAPRTTFGVSGAAVGIVIACTALVAFAGLRERTDARRLRRKPLRRDLIEILGFPIRNRPARLLILSYSCAVFATTVPVAVFRFVNKYVFTATGLEATFLGPLVDRLGTNVFLDIGVILGYFSGVFLSAPLWARALRTRDKKHGYVFAFLHLGVVTCGLFLIPRELGVLFPLLNVLVGAGALGLWMLPGALGPDCLEWEELHHGDRHEGGFYGIWMLVQKTGGGIALFAMGGFLDLIGFVPDRAQSAGTVMGLRFLYGGFPLAICLVAALLFSRYPLTRAVYADIRRRLGERRDAERETGSE
jgi:GPH family glycoside/pentoside/hexuronide:cation symporter